MMPSTKVICTKDITLFDFFIDLSAINTIDKKDILFSEKRYNRPNVLSKYFLINGTRQ